MSTPPSAERLRDASTRFSTPVTAHRCVASSSASRRLGGWIFYNTNVLNHYTTATRTSQAERYERDYGRYRDAPAPSFVDVELEVELYPDERRLVSRGSAVLRNNKQARR